MSVQDGSKKPKGKYTMEVKCNFCMCYFYISPSMEKDYNCPFCGYKSLGVGDKPENP